MVIYTLLFLHTCEETACTQGPDLQVRLAFGTDTSPETIHAAMLETFHAGSYDEDDPFDTHLIHPVTDCLRMLKNDPERNQILVWEDCNDEDDIMQFVIVKAASETPSAPETHRKGNVRDSTVQSLFEIFLSEYPDGDSFELARFMYERGLEKTTEQPEDSAS